MKTQECADCRDGENTTEGAIKLVIVRDPDTGKMVKRAYLCLEHIEMYTEDGYQIEIAN